MSVLSFRTRSATTFHRAPVTRPAAPGPADGTRPPGGRRMTTEGAEIAPGGVLLVGSVPLRSAEEVFHTMAGALGDRARRIPDGETGPRADWIVWQYPVLSSRPEFEVCPPADHAYRSLPRLRLCDGANPDTIRFEDLG